MKQTRRKWLTKMILAFAGVGTATTKLMASLPRVSPGGLSVPLVKHVTNNISHMKLGAFSVSLNVKDLKASKDFYENLGFTIFGGGMEKNYLIMKNGNALIGLFYGMFKQTILTFNPGWDENAQKVEHFEDVRAIQRQVKSKGIQLITTADESTTGPAGIMFQDPDGNQILIDQHV